MATKIAVASLQKYFQKLGYELPQVVESERFLHGFLSHAEGLFFLKIAKIKECNHFLINQVGWHNFVQSCDKITLFTSPPITNSGYYFDFFWFTYPYVSNKSMVNTMDLKSSSHLEEYLPMLTEIAYQISCVQPDLLFQDVINIRGGKYAAAMNEISLMQDGLIGIDISQLVSIFERLRHNLQISLKHGDLLPTHVFLTNPVPTIIDGEKANIIGTRFYDAAYLYYGIYIIMENKILAKKFLTSFDRHFDNDQDRQTFLANLIIIIIGGYWHTKKYNNRSLPMHNILKQEIIQERIFA